MRKEKRQLILDRSRDVFNQKGYALVTMQDLVDASEISRGGIYLYFQSVEEVFREIVLQRERTIIDNVRKLIDQNLEFDDVLTSYLSMQKFRLKHIDNSLSRAMYEYHFTQKDEERMKFRGRQVENMQETIRLVLEYGYEEGHLPYDKIEILVKHVMLTIEGLNIFALLGGLSNEKLQEQLDYLKVVIENA